MKSSIIYSNEKENYPMLMQSKAGTVILFKLSRVGTVVASNHKYEIGEYREDWIMDSFGKFNDKVVLEN
jgi:hypothetical protein